MSSFLNEQHQVAIVEQDQRRAATVLSEIERLAKRESMTALQLCKLLSESRREKYPQKVKNMTFDDWVDQASLGIGKRQANYYAKIWDVGTEELTISEDQLEEAGITKLKLIFTLDPEQFEPEIRDLVERAPDMTVDHIKEEVKALKAPGEEDFSWINAPILREDKDIYYDKAIMLVRMRAGQTLDVKSNSGKDLSEGAAIAHLAQAFLQDPNNEAEKMGEGGTFTDSVEIGDMPDESEA